MTDGAGSESYAYDALNRLTAVTRGADAFAYTYDLAGNPLSRTPPGGASTTYTYDDGRIASATTAGAATTYGYDPAANLLTAATPDGITARHSYDRAGRLMEVAHTSATGTLSRFSYGLDAAGRRTSVTSTQGAYRLRVRRPRPPVEVCYGACPTEPPVPTLPCLACIGDPLPRQAPDTPPDPADTFVGYTYDLVGNRLTESTHLGSTTYAYDAADRLASVTRPGQAAAPDTYDANGNQTAAGLDTFAWDAADRLTSANVDGTGHMYTYAGDGRRLRATTGGVTTNFVWDVNFGLPMLVAERDGGAILRVYTYGLDLLRLAGGGSTSYYHHDGLGSVTGSTGDSLAWSEFAPF